MKNLPSTRSLLMILCLLLCSCQEINRIHLDGTWTITLEGQPEATEIRLPGTTDTNHLGEAVTDTTLTTRLSRRLSYVGAGTYTRQIEIPQPWQEDDTYLFLERTKPTDVYVDGELLSRSDRISTPQIHPLGRLSAGQHQLTIVVDNSSRVPQQLYASSHAYTEDTQTNWNGIIGDIYLHRGEPQLATPVENPLPCFRQFHIEGKQFYADGHPIYLRGKTDNCVWPLTGHVPMDVESWTRYLGICQEYGLNHLRFHSWCPPEAAFVAADRMGFYLPPELPFWVDFNPKGTLLMEYLHDEGEAILRTYGHHPSFVMFALGNELWGDIPTMSRFVREFRQIAPDKLYTLGTNFYLGYQGVQPEMDYFTTCRVGGEGWGRFGTHTRGSFSFADAFDGGLLNHCYPQTTMTLDEGCSLSPVPVISHETGQFQTYPDYREIEKYSGVLTPHNLRVFRSRLEKAGMADQADAFHRASGLWSLQLYKADIELDLRTRQMAGFQLLDLQDYPGQGSAYIGILDAFLESKGLCTPEEWRQWCSPIVPLALLPKYCYQADEPLSVGIKIANYSGQSLKGEEVRLTLSDDANHEMLREATLRIDTDSLGLIQVGTADLHPSEDQLLQARRLTLRIAVGSDLQIGHNTYPIWIYPTRQPLDEARQEVIVTRRLTDAIGQQLEAGARVLFLPDSTQYGSNHVDGLFTTDYWNFRMFKTISENNGKPVSPGTLGLLTDPEHPLFREFPTEMHTNWQWFPILRASHPLLLDHTGPAYRPIVQVIDNIERNHKLGLVFELAVGQGKLLVVMSDLEQASAYPEGRQFYLSLLRYMNSPAFAPSTSVSLADVRRLMMTEVEEGKIGELNNISPY